MQTEKKTDSAKEIPAATDIEQRISALEQRTDEIGRALAGLRPDLHSWTPLVVPPLSEPEPKR
jgi:hypothetical protein